MGGQEWQPMLVGWWTPNSLSQKLLCSGPSYTSPHVPSHLIVHSSPLWYFVINQSSIVLGPGKGTRRPGDAAPKVRVVLRGQGGQEGFSGSRIMSRCWAGSSLGTAVENMHGSSRHDSWKNSNYYASMMTEATEQRGLSKNIEGTWDLISQQWRQDSMVYRGASG